MPQYELNIRDYLRIFRKRRVSIISTFVIVSVASHFFFSQKKSILYETTSVIKIEEHKTIAGLLTEWVVYNPGNVMESEAKAIVGYPVIKKVAVLHDMIEAGASKDEVNTVVSRLQSAVATEQIGNTNMIRITVTWDEARTSMDLANTIAEVFIQENLLAKSKQARSARVFIQEQLTAIEQRLLTVEEKISDFGDTSAQFNLAEPIKQQLFELGTQRMQMLQKYTARHPQVIRVEEQIASIEARLDTEQGSQEDLQFTRLNREREINQKLYAMLKEKLEEARINEAQKVSDISLVNPALMPENPLAAGSERLNVIIGAFMGLIVGVALAFTLETLDTSIGTIEDVERVVKLPVLGVIPSFERIAQKKKSFMTRIQEQFSSKQPEDFITKKVRLVAHFEPRSVITEAYRNIHTNLKLDPTRKTVMITSSSPQEGKSTVACNLAVVMAQVGLKTLIVSTDLRRPAIDKTFGLERYPGLNELLRGTAALPEVLRNITDLMLGDMHFDEIRKTAGLDNLWIIPPGNLPSNPVELLESKGIEDLLVALKAQFDVIIFDTPPVLPVTDASLLAPHMDNVVIVYEIGRTSRDALLRTKVQTESVGGNIVGIVLNHTRSEVEVMTNYPYYYRYKYTEYGIPEESRRGSAAKPAHTSTG